MGQGSAPSDDQVGPSEAVAGNNTAYGVDGLGGHTLELLEAAGSYNRWIVDFLRPYLGKTNLELGAGRGTLLDIVGKTHNVVPFEISEPQRQAIERRFEGHPRVSPCRSDIFNCEDWGTFDCIYSANVLEHIEQDGSMLAHCSRLLRVGAWCVAFVPAHQWLYSSFDRKIGHYRRYGRNDILRLKRVESAGAALQLRHVRFVNLPGALGWLVKMRLLARNSVSSIDATIVGSIVPLIRAIDTLRLPFGQSAVFVWQRI